MRDGSTTEPADVIDFWFGAPGSAERSQFRAEWFAVDAGFDAEIRSRFQPDWERLQRGELEAWRADATGALAYVIVADQFPRNLFRQDARAYASDALALAAAAALVDSGGERTLTPLQRCFVYLPFEHAESTALQTRSVQLYAALAEQYPDMGGLMRYALEHQDLIARFGRFPARNAALGRTSTAAELAFLAAADEPPATHRSTQV